MVDQINGHASGVDAFELVEADTPDARDEALVGGADLKTLVEAFDKSKLCQDVASIKSEITEMKNEIASMTSDNFTKEAAVSGAEDGADLNTVVKSLDGFNENVDYKVDTLGKDVAGMKSEITMLKREVSTMTNDVRAIKSLMEEESKQKALERAAQLTHIGNFIYYYGGSSTTYHSRDLAKTAIEHFMLGCDYTILPNRALVKCPIRHSEPEQKAFRERFLGQMKKLIGHEPGMKQENGDFIISYK